jgi:hypothetical protein
MEENEITHFKGLKNHVTVHSLGAQRSEKLIEIN